MGVLELVARMASRSLRSERRRIESSSAGVGCCSDGTVLLVAAVGAAGLMGGFGDRDRDLALDAGLIGIGTGGFLVGSSERFLGRELNAASRFPEWTLQKCTYLSTIFL